VEMVRGTGQRLGMGVVTYASAAPRRKPAILPSLLACDLATLANEANRVCPEKTDYVSLCPPPARAAARHIVARHGRKTGGLGRQTSHRRPVRGRAAWWHRQCTVHVVPLMPVCMQPTHRENKSSCPFVRAHLCGEA
jgi:hypothetical protein